MAEEGSKQNGTGTITYGYHTVRYPVPFIFRNRSLGCASKSSRQCFGSIFIESWSGGVKKKKNLFLSLQKVPYLKTTEASSHPKRSDLGSSSQNLKFLNFFYFCGSFLPAWIGIRIPNPGQDPGKRFQSGSNQDTKHLQNSNMNPEPIYYLFISLQG